MKAIIKNEQLRISKFLLDNGYKEDFDNESEMITFHKEGVSSIDFNEEEIVLIGEQGDWLHLPLSMYALLGALLHFRQLAIDYK